VENHAIDATDLIFRARTTRLKNEEIKKGIKGDHTTRRIREKTSPSQNRQRTKECGRLQMKKRRMMTMRMRRSPNLMMMRKAKIMIRS
jgi:hypothetical protein